MDLQLIQDLLTAISGVAGVPGESLPDAWHEALGNTSHSPLSLVINALDLPFSPTDLFIELETATAVASPASVAADLLIALSGSPDSAAWNDPLIENLTWTRPTQLLAVFSPELADALATAIPKTNSLPKAPRKSESLAPPPAPPLTPPLKSGGRSTIPLSDIIAFAGLALEELIKNKTLRSADLGELADALGDDPSAQHYQVHPGMTQRERSIVYNRRNSLLRRLQTEGYIVRDPESPHTKATYSWTGVFPDPQVYGTVFTPSSASPPPPREELEPLTEEGEEQIPLVPVVPPTESEEEIHLCEARLESGHQCAEIVETEPCETCGGAHYTVVHEDDGTRSWLCSEHSVPCAEEIQQAAQAPPEATANAGNAAKKRTPKKKTKKKRTRRAQAKLGGDEIDQIARFVSRWDNVAVEGLPATRTRVSANELPAKRILCPLWDVKPRMPARRGGDPRSWKNARRDLRNLPCPCGSGRIVKDCHNISQ